MKVTHSDKDLARKFILAAKKAAQKHGMRKVGSDKNQYK